MDLPQLNSGPPQPQPLRTVREKTFSELHWWKFQPNAGKIKASEVQYHFCLFFHHLRCHLWCVSSTKSQEPVLWIRIHWIRIRHFKWIQIRVLMTKNWISKLQQFFSFFFIWSKMQFTYPWASIKNVQATEEALALKREHLALQKMTFINFFHCCGFFCPTGSGFMDPLESGSGSITLPGCQGS